MSLRAASFQPSRSNVEISFPVRLFLFGIRYLSGGVGRQSVRPTAECRKTHKCSMKEGAVDDLIPPRCAGRSSPVSDRGIRRMTTGARTEVLDGVTMRAWKRCGSPRCGGWGFLGTRRLCSCTEFQTPGSNGPSDQPDARLPWLKRHCCT